METATAVSYTHLDVYKRQTLTYERLQLYEFTGTYEYKWLEGLLMRAEYRADFSNQNVYSKDVGQYVKSQQTLTIAFVAFFGPKR